MHHSSHQNGLYRYPYQSRSLFRILYGGALYLLRVNTPSTERGHHGTVRPIQHDYVRIAFQPITGRKL